MRVAPADVAATECGLPVVGDASLGPGDVVLAVRDGVLDARFHLRVEEFRTSLRMVEELSGTIGSLDARGAVTTRSLDSGLGIVEGWRGTILHRVELDPTGTISRARTIDPSFFNWPALSVALSDTIVPDFPLANKSFNLSYAGNDL